MKNKTLACIIVRIKQITLFLNLSMIIKKKVLTFIFY